MEKLHKSIFLVKVYRTYEVFHLFVYYCCKTIFNVKSNHNLYYLSSDICTKIVHFALNMFTSTCILTFAYPFSSVLSSVGARNTLNNWFCICVLISLKHKRLTFRMVVERNIFRTRRKLFCCRLYWLHPPTHPQLSR